MDEGAGRTEGTRAHAAWLLVWLTVAAFGAVAVSPPASSLAIWWPATYVAVGVLLLQPVRRWPVLLPLGVLAITAGQLLADRWWALSLGLGVMTASEALAITLVLRRSGTTRLQRMGDIGWLLLANVAGALVLSVGLAMMTSSVLLPDSAYGPLLGQVLLSHVTAALTLGPLFLTTSSRAHAPARERVLQWLVLLAVIALVFVPDGRPSMPFLVLPILLWGALRQSPRVVAMQTLTLAGAAVVLTSADRGPFDIDPASAYADWPTATAALQGYLSSFALAALVVAVTIAHQRSAAAAASQERDFNQTVLESSDALVLVVGLDGIVQQVNRATEVSTGWTAEELVGRPLWSRLVLPRRRAAVAEAFRSGGVLAAGSLSGVEAMLAADGHIRRVTAAVSPLLDDTGRPRAVVVTGLDVTRERTADGMLTRFLRAPSSTAFVGMDVTGRITVFSQGAVDLLGIDAETAVGQSFGTLVLRDPPGDVSPAEQLARLTALGSTRAADRTWHRADGSTVLVSQTLDAVSDGAGLSTGYLVTARDVTEQRGFQELLLAALEKERDAVDRLQALDEAKNDFVTTVSHELRTPVTSIVGYIEMFEDEMDARPEPASQHLLDVVRRNAFRLRDLADDLVTLSAFQSASAQVVHGTVDLREVVSRAVDAVHQPARHRRVSIELVLPEAPVAVQGDSDHLERAVGNLLLNAVKFSHDQSTVHVELHAEGGTARVVVEDAGLGVPADEVDHVFTRFYRCRNAQAQAIQGTGLGLSIVASIVGAHGGDVSLSSVEHEGTIVDVRLPLAAGA